MENRMKISTCRAIVLCLIVFSSGCMSVLYNTSKRWEPKIIVANDNMYKSVLLDYDDAKKRKNLENNTQIGNLSYITDESSSDQHEAVLLFTDKQILVLNTSSKDLRIKYTQDNAIILYLLKGLAGIDEAVVLGDGKGEYIVQDLQGNVIEIFSIEGRESAVADYNKDGYLEIIYSDHDNILSIDRNGQKLWEIDCDSCQYSIDTDKKLLFATNYNNNRVLIAEAHSGEVIKEVVVKVGQDRWIDRVSSLEWGKELDLVGLDMTTGEVIAFSTEGMARIVNANEPIEIKEYWSTGITVETVKLCENRDKYLVIIRRPDPVHDRSMLSLYDDNMQLVYREIMKATNGIAVVSNNAGKESFIVAEDSKTLWQYYLETCAHESGPVQ